VGFFTRYYNIVRSLAVKLLRTGKLIKFRYAKYDAILFLCNILQVNSWLTLENWEVNSAS